MSQPLNPMEGPKWEACASVFRHFGVEPDTTFQRDFQVKNLAQTQVEALRTGAMAWIDSRTTPPRYWSEFWSLVPQSAPKAGAKAGSRLKEKTEESEPEKVKDWWGNEGGWGGDWKEASGRSMIIPAATMTVNARGKYFQNRVAEYRKLAIRRGANPDLLAAAIKFASTGRELNKDVLRKLETDPDFYDRPQSSPQMVAATTGNGIA